ncbi:MAG: enoyl-CoA hydratase/isomerase family protein [Proteobacteria bacterium]|nr:enoyl-CoA hydratase/isomerase family protein [Pseudomonadota bacterium]
MQLPDCEEILLNIEDGVLYLTLNRPQKRNAMNDKLVSEVMQTFDAIEQSRDIRAVVLRGAGGHFCAGGDISGMNKITQTPEQAKKAAWEFNRAFGRMITRVNRAPQLVITLLEGAVLGGGFGLACISDIAIADSGAKLAMPETGLGIPPAQIAPFVVMRIGLTQTRRLALLGERIGGAEAVRLGLVHYVTEGEEAMQSKLDEVLTKLRRCAPNATAITKRLLLDVASTELEALLDRASDDFSAAINSDEGRDGTLAFIEKRKPFWA